MPLISKTRSIEEDVDNEIAAKALDGIRLLIFNVLRNTEYEKYNHIDTKRLQNKKLCDLSDVEKLDLLQDWIFSYTDRNHKELAEFSDEDIVGEFNRRMQEGRVDSSTKFFVTRKGSVN